MSSDDENFFEAASSKIYEWLDDYDKVEFLSELSDEGIQTISELKPALRFFRLLNFIEIKYVKIESRLNDLLDFITELNLENSDFLIHDLVFLDENNESVSIFKLKELISEAKPENTFKKTLDKLELTENYNQFKSPQKDNGKNGD